MSDYDQFLDEVEKGIKELVEKTLNEFKDEALSDAKAFLEASQSDLKQWATQFAKGELSENEFKWLIKGREDVAELHALKQSGLAQVQLDKFRTALLDLLIDTASNVL